MRLIDADALKKEFPKDTDWEYPTNTNEYVCEKIDEQSTVQPERKAVFNRDIAIEAICDEVMLWFDISATKAYEIADTAVKRIEVRMEKMDRGEQE